MLVELHGRSPQFGTKKNGAAIKHATCSELEPPHKLGITEWTWHDTDTQYCKF